MGLFGSTLSQLEAYVVSHGLPKYQALPLFKRLYKGSDTLGFLPKSFSQVLEGEKLEHECTMESKHVSNDGTKKFLTKIADGKLAETVIIPEFDRVTACISSQVGCSLKCTFCHTGSQKFQKNLTSHDILAQIALANSLHKITNVVFMGQGEPLYNFSNVKDAVQILTHPDGFGLSKTKVTVSTSGIAPHIPNVAKELGVNLAISLHAASNDLRTQIMAINKSYPLESLLDACREFSSHTPCSTRRITLEYLMLKDINDTKACARDLIEFAKHIPIVFVNLIPWNPWPGAPSNYHCSPRETISEFRDILDAAGIPVAIRKTRGDDILAACGQLKSVVQ